ncbi:MAG: hypothetical protein ACFFCW_49485 [Candidatus Hodarchaeota archaeon]
MKNLDFKEMSLQEKYDSLLESFIMTMAIDYALFEELGEDDRYLDMHVKVRKRMLPNLLGAAFKLFKMVSPKRAVEQVIKKYAYTQQMYLTKTNIEIRWNSKGKVIGRIRNCPNLSKLKDILKKAGLDIDPRFHCEIELKVLKELAKEFGLDAYVEMEEKGCQFTAKLG